MKLFRRHSPAFSLVLPDGPALRNRQLPSALARTALLTLLAWSAGVKLQAGDILRGGAGVRTTPAASGNVTSNTAATNLAKIRATDSLARTTQAVQSVQAMQNAARQIALRGANNLGADPNHAGLKLPNVPNGLAMGGLKTAPGVPVSLAHPTATENPALWQGASLPVQSSANGRTQVTITQNTSQALLTWETFNVGNKTTVSFDQTAGGETRTQWIAFNKILDPSGVPSQILGHIEAQGQVYLINQNGIIFGGASQVNLHTLVASALPINDNLISRGLLNNPDFQFLFSSPAIDAGPNGTPSFTPADTKSGAVTVQSGASLIAPTTADHVGGRIALFGANVSNAGTISTPDGQTILAAGQQVGLVAHASTDPSLRGLDVYVGSVDEKSGTATNSGLLDATGGNITIAGKNIRQNGAAVSTTSVSLNGRIDLLTNYNTISVFPANGSPFFSPSATGIVTLGPGSVTQVLPEYASPETVVGTQLALNSAVNLQGQGIHLAKDAILLAPSANVAIQAGSYVPLDEGFTFALTTGQIYLDAGATIDVSGSRDIAASVSDNFVSVELRGAELANSPLQRNGPLRGQTVQVDIRQTGIYDGKPWIGTPLGDASGYVGLIQRNVGQLTTNGGSVTLNAGESLVLQPGSTISVSGGWLNYTGANVQTTKVSSNGQVLDISDATPDRIYDGIYQGFTQSSDKFGTSETFTGPLLVGSRFEPGYIQGGNGGSISILAPSVAIDGALHGNTVVGPQQLTNAADLTARLTGANFLPAIQTVLGAPAASSLSLTFQHDEQDGTKLQPSSPTPPAITFDSNKTLAPANPFALDDAGSPIVLNKDRQSEVILSPELIGVEGFSTFKIENSDGWITLPRAITLTAAASGSITLQGANIDLQGSINARGGVLDLTVLDFSPYASALLPDGTLPTTPPPDPTRGLFTLGSNATLNVAGVIIDNRSPTQTAANAPFSTAGGAIRINTYSARLTSGSIIDASGGASVSALGRFSYGKGGSISLLAGRDPAISSLIGGELTLDATLLGTSGVQGGSLTLQFPQIQIGGQPTGDRFLLKPAFFNQGGFGSFVINGLGAAAAEGSENYLPGLVVAANTALQPVAASSLGSFSASGDPILETVVQPEALRTAVSLTLAALGATDPFTNVLIARGDAIAGIGSRITTDAKGSVSVRGDTVTLLGSISAPGGTISINGGRTFSAVVPPSIPLPTVDLGAGSHFSVAGTTLLTPNALGLRTGLVLPGGTINVAGNIVAEAGSVLDVSGTTGTLDVLPGFIGETPGSKPTGLQLVQTRVDSNGGTINLAGSQELFTDATLLGKAGGSSALGGILNVSSGRFIQPGTSTPVSPLDVSLVVSQGRLTIPALTHPDGTSAVGSPLLDAQGDVLSGQGYFAANRFLASGLEQLTLGGTVQFLGPVNISAARSLNVANGGVIFAEAGVNLNAPYVVLGTPFTAPIAVADRPDSAFLAGGQPIYFSPTFGPGNLKVQAKLLDLGNLSLQNIGAASLTAANGDIRGNGTIDIAGSLTLTAGQIYPPTGVSLTFAASDYEQRGINIPGSITILASGPRQLPLAAGGELNVYASNIIQGGVLRAPIGQINLGSGVTGANPLDLISNLPVASTQTLTLLPGSITSVSAIDPVTGGGVLIPYGSSTNGITFLDPTGTDIFVNGVPEKAVTLNADNVDDQPKSLIDLRGGGDLYGYRFVAGVGGTVDVLASTASFAVIPDFQADYAPYNPGYDNPTLAVGDRVYLQASAGLPAGPYTLLPARYALLPGAFLVTPATNTPPGSVVQTDGASLVSGYRFNDLSVNRKDEPLFAAFEVAPQNVILARAQYDNFLTNSFLPQSAVTRNTDLPRLPMDAGRAVLAAGSQMSIEGSFAAQAAPGALGSLVDIGSTSAIYIGGNGKKGPTGSLILDATALTNIHADSLLIGGFRQNGTDGVQVSVITSDLTLDNAGAPLLGPDIILAATTSLTLAAGADLEQSGTLASAADSLRLGDATVPGSGNGTLLRVSSDPEAQTVRAGLDASTQPLLTINPRANISGASVTLDSTSGTALNATAVLSGTSVNLNSGQILLQLANAGTVPTGTSLTLSSAALQTLQKTAQTLSLLSYSSIDLYGSGAIGNKNTALALHAAGLRGFGGTVSIAANGVSIDNSPGGTIPESDSLVNTGTLTFNANTVEFGEGISGFSVQGFNQVKINASNGVQFSGTGSFATSGSLSLVTFGIKGATGANQTISSTGALTIGKPAGPKQVITTDGLGARLTLQGSSVTANSTIVLPSGLLTIRATSGNLTVGDSLDLSGTAQTFNDLTKYTNGGLLNLISETGSISLTSGSTLNLSAQTGGGNAGSLTISAPQGTFSPDGALAAKAGAGGKNGNFLLDVSQLASLGTLNAALNTSSFLNSRGFRVRTGDVLVDGAATAQHFTLAVDQGSISITGTIDAAGTRGGTIQLYARDGLTLSDGALLSAAGTDFDAAGKGGQINLETRGGDIRLPAGSIIDLSVAGGKGGVLHLRAPQTADNTDLQISAIDGTIRNASRIEAEGYQTYDLTGTDGTITDATKDEVRANGTLFGGSSESISARLLANNGALAPVLSVETGAEVINPTGDLTLTSDWDLSTYRFGAANIPGVLTLRASGNLNFNFAASLSDGFDTTAGSLWQAPLLAEGSRSWSYRLVAGADFDAADFHGVNEAATGSLLLGSNAGANGLLPVTQSDDRSSIISTYFQVIRTGTGDIDIAAAQDVQLLNPLATIYTAGSKAKEMADFELPNLEYESNQLGATQSPIYPAQYSLGGGNVTISAQNDVARYNIQDNGSSQQRLADSSRELPTNWLYRRGYIDPTTGQFGVVPRDSGSGVGEVASTSWWIDFSNFFEGVGTLGGGNITIIAGHDVTNVDAAIPTNARMPKGTPDAAKLQELGGGDLLLQAGHDIDGGVYYVERGQGKLEAGNSIQTNATRAALTQGEIINDQIRNIIPDETTWLPTTLFAGKSSFEVSAQSDLLLGPTANPFLLPQGINNSFYEKSYFTTYSPTAALDVTSLTGAITVKTTINGTRSALAEWYRNVLLFYQTPKSFSQSQPWLRLAETSITPFGTAASLMPSTLHVSAFSGDINIVSNLTLLPAPRGTIDLTAAGSLNGLQPNGLTRSSNGEFLKGWSPATINLSDADPSALAGVSSPLSPTVDPDGGFLGGSLNFTQSSVLNSVNSLFNESGSTQGVFAVLQTKQALHAPGLLHQTDPNPVHLYALGGDISGLTLFSAKAARIIAGNDVTDIALYLQNNGLGDISLVSAGRDLVAYNPSSVLAIAAQAPGNALNPGTTPLAGDIQISGGGTIEVLAGRNFDLGVGPNNTDGTALGLTSIGNARNPYLAFAGADIIAAAGMGTAASLGGGSLNFAAFNALYLDPASSGENGARYLPELAALMDPADAGADPWTAFQALPAEEQATLSLDIFYLVLRDAGRDHNDPASANFGKYDNGFAAIDALFPAMNGVRTGDISLTSREIKTASGGNISLLAPGGQLTVGFDISGTQASDQGILTEDGGNISIFTDQSVIVGTSRIFTLRGGDEILWSSQGDIAAGASSKTVQSAPPTRVLIDPQSGDVQTDLAGLATGGGIGVLATVAGLPPSDVDLIAPAGVIDAGDAGIRATGNLNVAALQILNASNIQVGGSSVGTPAVVAPGLGALAAASASNSAAQAASTANESAAQNRQPPAQEQLPSIIVVEVLGYGGGAEEEDSEEKRKRKKSASQTAPSENLQRVDSAQVAEPQPPGDASI